MWWWRMARLEKMKILVHCNRLRLVEMMVLVEEYGYGGQGIEE
jgi:hypothetical protein